MVFIYYLYSSLHLIIVYSYAMTQVISKDNFLLLAHFFFVDGVAFKSRSYNFSILIRSVSFTDLSFFLIDFFSMWDVDELIQGGTSYRSLVTPDFLVNCFLKT